MSTAAKISDQIHFLSDLVSIEQEPLRRLAIAEEVYRQAMAVLQKQLHAAAYEARTKYAIRDIETATGIDASRVSYYTRKHAHKNGLTIPGQRVRVRIDSFIDLSRE